MEVLNDRYLRDDLQFQEEGEGLTDASSSTKNRDIEFIRQKGSGSLGV